MIFHDQIEIVEGQPKEDSMGDIWYDWRNPVVVATAPAQVDVERSTLGDLGTDRRISYLTAYTHYRGFDTYTQRIRWRGTMYLPDGDIVERTIGRRIHHTEIPLKRVDG